MSLPEVLQAANLNRQLDSLKTLIMSATLDEAEKTVLCEAVDAVSQKTCWGVKFGISGAASGNKGGKKSVKDMDAIASPLLSRYATAVSQLILVMLNLKQLHPFEVLALEKAILRINRPYKVPQNEISDEQKELYRGMAAVFKEVGGSSSSSSTSSLIEVRTVTAAPISDEGNTALKGEGEFIDCMRSRSETLSLESSGPSLRKLMGADVKTTGAELEKLRFESVSISEEMINLHSHTRLVEIMSMAADIQAVIIYTKDRERKKASHWATSDNYRKAYAQSIVNMPLILEARFWSEQQAKENKNFSYPAQKLRLEDIDLSDAREVIKKWLYAQLYKRSRTTKSLAKTIDDELEKSTEVIDKIILQELKEEFAAGVAGEANDVTAEKEKSRKSKNISAASSSSKFTTPKSSTTRPVSALLCLFLYIIYYIPFLRSLLLYEERQQQQR